MATRAKLAERRAAVAEYRRKMSEIKDSMARHKIAAKMTKESLKGKGLFEAMGLNNK